jgi:hypothetical protein
VKIALGAFVLMILMLSMAIEKAGAIISRVNKAKLLPRVELTKTKVGLRLGDNPRRRSLT